MGDVLADLSVPARGAPLERAVAIDQRNRQPVDFRLGHVLELRILDALAGQVVAHPLDPRPELVGGARVAEREHGLGVADLNQVADRLATDSLGGRVRRDELGVGRFDRPEFVEQRVVLVVADLRIVQDVVAIAVVVEQPAELGGPLARVRRGRRRLLRDAHGSVTSRSAGSIRRARSCCCSADSPSRSVRSKWIGVTAIRPSATAVTSVPGSSAP